MSQVGGNALSKILGLILLVVCLPIFAGLGMLSADYSGLMDKMFSIIFMLSQNIFTTISGTASAGIVSMGDIIIQFMPLFGIGAEIAGLMHLRRLRPISNSPSLISTIAQPFPY